MLGEIQKKIDRSRDKILEFAKEMISFKTPNPPAHNTKEIQLWMEDELKKIGMKTAMHDLYTDEPEKSIERFF